MSLALCLCLLPFAFCLCPPPRTDPPPALQCLPLLSGGCTDAISSQSNPHENARSPLRGSGQRPQPQLPPPLQPPARRLDPVGQTQGPLLRRSLPQTPQPRS